MIALGNQVVLLDKQFNRLLEHKVEEVQRISGLDIIGLATKEDKWGKGVLVTDGDKGVMLVFDLKTVNSRKEMVKRQ